MVLGQSPFSSRHLMKMIPGWPERFPAAITAIAQPPTGHQRTHREKQHPPNTLSSSQLKPWSAWGSQFASWAWLGSAWESISVSHWDIPSVPVPWGAAPYPRCHWGCAWGLEIPLLCWPEPSLCQEGTRLAVRLWHRNCSYDNPQSQTCLSPLVKIHNNHENRE